MGASYSGTSALDDIAAMRKVLDERPGGIVYHCTEQVKSGDIVSSTTLFGEVKLVFLNPDDYKPMRNTIIMIAAEATWAGAGYFFEHEIASLDKAYKEWTERKENTDGDNPI